MTSQPRWAELDVLRGLSVIGMLLALNPGAWAHQYAWLIHAKWEGATLIDMVAPVFLFCIGGAIPFSLRNRILRGDINQKILKRIAWRSLALVFVGLLLNAYPAFDLSHTRIPGVLQRIGIGFGLAATLVLFLSTRKSAKEGVTFKTKSIAGAAVFILFSYWSLLYLVPVPGYGAPRFDPIGSWPSVIDRAVFGTNHLFIHWPVDGKITFDPDGLVSTYPVLFNILLGSLAGIFFIQKTLQRPITIMLTTGLVLMALAWVLRDICPIIKNIWTSTFAMLSGGFALVALAGLAFISYLPRFQKALFPAFVFGANPLLAYVLCWLLMPVLDVTWINTDQGFVSVRYGSQLMLRPFMEVKAASFLFSVCYLAVVFIVLWSFQRKRWFIRL